MHLNFQRIIDHQFFFPAWMNESLESLYLFILFSVINKSHFCPLSNNQTVIRPLKIWNSFNLKQFQGKIEYNNKKATTQSSWVPQPSPSPAAVTEFFSLSLNFHHCRLKLLRVRSSENISHRFTFSPGGALPAQRIRGRMPSVWEQHSHRVSSFPFPSHSLGGTIIHRYSEGGQSNTEKKTSQSRQRKCILPVFPLASHSSFFNVVISTPP